jgi:hypothetical protein
MKKLIIILPCLILAGLLVSCGGGGGTTSGDPYFDSSGHFKEPFEISIEEGGYTYTLTYNTDGTWIYTKYGDEPIGEDTNGNGTPGEENVLLEGLKGSYTYDVSTMILDISFEEKYGEDPRGPAVNMLPQGEIVIVDTIPYTWYAIDPDLALFDGEMYEIGVTASFDVPAGVQSFAPGEDTACYFTPTAEGYHGYMSYTEITTQTDGTPEFGKLTADSLFSIDDGQDLVNWDLKAKRYELEGSTVVTEEGERIAGQLGYSSTETVGDEFVFHFDSWDCDSYGYVDGNWVFDENETVEYDFDIALTVFGSGYVDEDYDDVDGSPVPVYVVFMYNVMSGD